MTRPIPALLAGLLAGMALLGLGEKCRAQMSLPPQVTGLYAASPPSYFMGKYFYYPYYYFPHSYWPQNSPPWPERPGEPYRRAPGYMAYPPFHEPHWRYELWQNQRYYRGFHFWLDQF